MKKIMIVTAVAAFALTFGVAFAYADEMPRFSENNNIGVLLYAETHPIYKAETGVTCGNWTSAELFPVQKEYDMPAFSENNNIGVFLYEDTHPKEIAKMGVSEAEGSGAGGVSSEMAAGKCKLEKGEWKPFSINRLYDIPGVKFMRPTD